MAKNDLVLDQLQRRFLTQLSEFGFLSETPQTLGKKLFVPLKGQYFDMVVYFTPPGHQDYPGQIFAEIPILNRQDQERLVTEIDFVKKYRDQVKFISEIFQNLKYVKKESSEDAR